MSVEYRRLEVQVGLDSWIKWSVVESTYQAMDRVECVVHLGIAVWKGQHTWADIYCNPCKIGA